MVLIEGKQGFEISTELYSMRKSYWKVELPGMANQRKVGLGSQLLAIVTLIHRIDNSGPSVICTFDHKSETVLVIKSCNVPNKR